MSDLKGHQTSDYYFKYTDSEFERLDENYHHPRYDMIDQLFARSKYRSLFLKVGESEDCLLQKMSSGGTPEKVRYLNGNGGVAFLGAGDIDSRGNIDLENARRIETSIHLGELGNSQIRRKDVLVTMAGTVGHCAMYESEMECNCNQAIAVLCPNDDKVNPQYLARYLNSTLAQLQFGKLQHIADQPNINLDEMQKIRVILPDLDEQSAILSEVERIEKKAISKEKATDSRLEQVDKVVMDELGIAIPDLGECDYYSLSPQLMSSRLDFSYNEPFYGLLEEAMQGCQYEFLALVPPLVTYSEETTNPLERPNESFEYVDISNIDIRWGEMKSVVMSGKDATSSRVRRVMHGGEILISTTRPTRRAIAMVSDELDGQVCSTGFAVLRCSQGIDKHYLLCILRSNLLKAQFERYSSGSSYPEINKDNDLPLVRIPSPPLNLQKKIVREVFDMMKEAKVLDAEAQSKWNEAQARFDSLLISAD